ncbi:hypothetical protein [Planococcus sp. 107-1]|uniref:hypothetical protein n=1 Tax=Planococcus sp. 107-1 TaxID=2908840 RepID=UPI001F2D2D89|nr:hypothetical protein [Planococcus sp. 107-1]UJF27640.1 hypothetical protein L0M13_04035 [Planococcus sp. 107-1]
MVEKQLIDKKATQDFFVYMSNRGIESTFPLIGEDPSALLKRAYEEVGMGYTALFIYKRMAIVELDEWTDLSLADVGQPKSFRNFLFVQVHPQSEHIAFSAFEKYEDFYSLKEAVEAAQESIKQKQQVYPRRKFTVVCAAFVDSHNWH